MSADDRPADWEAPVPFRDEKGPPFPTAHLPHALAAFVEAAAVSARVPADVVALAALGVASAAVASKFVVRVRSDRLELANLWTASVLGSGEGKSSAFSLVLAPLRECERERAAACADAVARDASRRRVLEAQLAAAEKRAANGDDGADDERADLAEQLARLRPAQLFQLIVSDATPEALGACMAAQGGRIALVSDEAAGIFDVMRGRYSKDGRANLDVYLQGFSGTAVRVQRRSSLPLHVPRPCLVVATTMQPGVLSDVGAAAEMTDRGLLARFLWAVPVSLVGFRDPEPPELPAEVRERYGRIVRLLFSLAETRDDDGNLVATELPIEPAGASLLRELRVEVETGFRPGGRFENCREWANRIEGNAVRVALVLHLWREAEAADDLGESVRTPLAPVSVEAVESAVRLTREFFVPHGLAVVARIGADPAIVGARRLLEWIVRTGAATFSRRDAQRGNGWAQRVAQLDEPLRVLVERNFLRVVPPPTRADGKAGRPPSDIWEVNPRAAEALGQNRQNGQNPR